MKVLRRNTALLAVLLPALAACADDATTPTNTSRPSFDVVSEEPMPIALGDDLQATLVAINVELAAQGLGIAVRQADMSVVEGGDPKFANTVYANDRTHTINYRFVANDPRRATVGKVVRQATFIPNSRAPSVGNGARTILSKPSIDAAFSTWNGVNCSDMTVVNNLLPAGVANSALVYFGPRFTHNPFASDINTVGYFSAAFFDRFFGPGASNSILAVTFPFIFVDRARNPTDIDRDGNADAAFAEIWYNARFSWSTTGTGNKIDIETVALHENGHALGLGHFGKVSVGSNGKLHVSPRASMNAFILGTLREPLGTDNGSFCQTWASWGK